MSGFIPGLAAPGISLYEANTEIISVEPTLGSLTLPDPIPDFPQFLTYNINSGDPMNAGGSYLVSCKTTVGLSNIGSGVGDIIFRVGGSATSINNQDYIYVVPMLPYIQSGNAAAVISFTGLVRTLSGQFPKIFVSVDPGADTTDYEVQQIIVNYKTL